MNKDQSESAGVGARFDPGFQSKRFVISPQQPKQLVWNNQPKSAATLPTQPLHTNVAMTKASQPPVDGPALPPRGRNKQPASVLTPTSRTVNAYDRVIAEGSQSSNENEHTYLTVRSQSIPADDINSRIENVQEMQTILTGQFAEFRTDITTEMLSLKKISADLTTFMQDFSTKLQTSIDKIHFQMLENSDHLGKQIMEVRRDFVAASKRQGSVSSHQRLYVHSFEWEVQTFDSLVKNRRDSSSPFFHISQIDCKISGTLVCTNDERLRLLLLGELATSPKSYSTKFECSVYLVDKSGKQPEWLAGKFFGDFAVGKEWTVGEVSSREVKKKGFVAHTGNVHLKFVIEMCL